MAQPPTPQGSAERTGGGADAPSRGPSVFSEVVVEMAVLLAVCLFLCWLNWLKIEDLIVGDPPMWLLQASRAANGELPYRDFAWIYPPLSLFMFATLFRWFGATFAVANAGVIALGLASIGLFYLVARKVVGRRFGWALTLLFCACENHARALFTLRLYTPALPLGWCGLLMVLLGGMNLVEYEAESKQRDPHRWLWHALLFAGAFICLLSKLEFTAGLGGCLIAFAAVEWIGPAQPALPERLSRHGWRLLGAILPAGLLSLWLGSRTGFSDLGQGLQGYGLAFAACPWWPHVYGILRVLGGAGEAVFVLAILYLLRIRLYGGSKSLWPPIVTAIGGLAASIAYLYVIHEQVLAISMRSMPLRLLQYALELTTLLYAMMSLGVMLVAAMAFLLIRDAHAKVTWSLEWIRFFIIAGAASALSTRGLFGDFNSYFPTVCEASEPAWLLAAALLVRNMLSPKISRIGDPAEDAAPKNGVDESLAIAGICLAAAFLIGFTVADLHRPFHSLTTRAGQVRVLNYEQTAELYHFLESHLAPGAPLLELPKGAGLSFAARLRRPIYREEEAAVPIERRYLDRDVELIARNPPQFVIARKGPDFGIECCDDYSQVSCEFPRIVWRPREIYYPSQFHFPIALYVARHYTEVAEFGDMIVLRAR